MKHLIYTIISISIIALHACRPQASTMTNGSPIIEQDTMNGVNIPAGFEIKKIYQPGLHDQGSWVSMTKDDMGRLYASDQYGNIYRVTLPNSNNTLDSANVQKLDLNIGQAQGLLWHKGDLYVVVNSNEERDMKIHSGFYKLSDSDGNGDFDTVKELRLFDGEGEHGPHNVVLSPDGKSLYIVLGNHTDVPDDLKSVVPKVWGEDNLLPVILDPSGHANDRMAPGGWVVKTDFEGSEWILISVGMRNTYDIAFNPDGELFGFDSDMEYDMGMPWYRPIRLAHLTSGSDFGWRTGTGKFRSEYPDNLPGIANLGQGSPTGLLEGKGLKFPTYYQRGFYLFDWSYGTMYYADVRPKGSSYTAEVTEFLSGVPLPITNGIVGNDGSMYFLTGGRRLESALYKLTYTGDAPSDVVEFSENKKGSQDRQLRRSLEALHHPGASDKMDYIIDHLDHQDRFIRYAARVALEHQDYNLWKTEINKSKDPLKTISLSLSIAKHGNDTDRIHAINTLLKTDWTTLSEAQQIDYIRAVDLLIIRMDQDLPTSVSSQIVAAYLPSYLSHSDLINKEVCSLLSYLQVPDIIEPTLTAMRKAADLSSQKSIYLNSDVTQRSDQYGKDVERMLANMPNQQHISYAKSLSIINNGWTSALREQYFRWFNDALKKSGGLTYAQFIRAIQKEALSNIPAAEQAYFESLAGESMNQPNQSLEGVKQPAGPGQVWTVEGVIAAYAEHQSSVNMANGKAYFKSILCAACHSIQGEGGNTGPELSALATRFTVKDLAKAIINPSATISDRYEMTSYHMKDGSVITGTLREDNKNTLEISTNAYSPELTTKVRKNQIVKQEPAGYSSMPPGLINRLNPQELSDLIGYMMEWGAG